MWRGASVFHVTDNDDLQKNGGIERLVNLRHILEVEFIGPGDWLDVDSEEEGQIKKDSHISGQTFG